MTATIEIPPATLTGRDGQPRTVRFLDPLWDTVDNRRVRFVRMVDSVTVEIADNNGRTLPGHRHVTQLLPY